MRARKQTWTTTSPRWVGEVEDVVEMEKLEKVEKMEGGGGIAAVVVSICEKGVEIGKWR